MNCCRFEFCVGPPEVIIKEEDCMKLEPYEEAIIEVSEEFSGSVVSMLNARKGKCISQEY